MRTIAIGDIHGCHKALLGILDAIKPQPDDQLIFLGDYVDRGADSRGVIDTLIDLIGVCQPYFLIGNHELMFRGVLRGLPAELWLGAGGSQTLTSYGGKLDNVPATHLRFLESCLPYYETSNHIFVHANYIPEAELIDQPELALFWEHLLDRFPGPHHSGKHVICGHTPQPGGKIGYYQHLTCIDTCCFGGYWLSALDVDSGEVWQVSREGHLRENWRLIKRIRRILKRLADRPKPAGDAG